MDDFSGMLKNNKVDIACVTETWLSNDVPSEIISFDGYVIHRNDRSNKRCDGGVAVYVQETIPHCTWSELIDDGLETLWKTIRPMKMPRAFSHITLGIFYHPPNAMTQHVS